MREHRLQVNGTELCHFEWGEPGGQEVLLVHATGFHARCWDKVVALLPEDWHVYAVDLRGHGRSGKEGPYNWQQFGSDLLAVCEHLQLAGAIGVGHSMGGHCVTHVCAEAPHFFKALILVDPVIFHPESYLHGAASLPERVEDHPVARRRSHFASWQEMHERYKDRHPYKLWRPEIFRDYCEHGVVPSPQGGVDLCCPGIVEASVYMGNFSSNLHERIPGIQVPVKVLRAPPRDAASEEMDFAKSPTWPELAWRFPNGEDVFLPELTHFIPMQDPELVARHITAAA